MRDKLIELIGKLKGFIYMEQSLARDSHAPVGDRVNAGIRASAYRFVVRELEKILKEERNATND